MGFNAPLASQSRFNKKGDANASKRYIIHENDRFECVGTPRVSGASIGTLRRPSRKSRLRLVVFRQAAAIRRAGDEQDSSWKSLINNSGDDVRSGRRANIHLTRTAAVEVLVGIVTIGRFGSTAYAVQQVCYENLSHAACLETPNDLPIASQLVPRSRRVLTWTCNICRVASTVALQGARESSNCSSVMACQPVLNADGVASMLLLQTPRHASQMCPLAPAIL